MAVIKNNQVRPLPLGLVTASVIALVDVYFALHLRTGTPSVDASYEALLALLALAAAVASLWPERFGPVLLGAVVGSLLIAARHNPIFLRLGSSGLFLSLALVFALAALIQAILRYRDRSALFLALGGASLAMVVVEIYLSMAL